MVKVIGKKPETRGKDCEMKSGVWEGAVDRRGKDRGRAGPGDHSIRKDE